MKENNKHKLNENRNQHTVTFIKVKIQHTKKKLRTTAMCVTNVFNN